MASPAVLNGRGRLLSGLHLLHCLCVVQLGPLRQYVIVVNRTIGNTVLVLFVMVNYYSGSNKQNRFMP